ncbi:tetratricopeptide repeat protein [Rhodospirillaceae bacterium KN72]|uniref:Tetratricopeptide repeat protein n=1 Tax=Pacificispira spongiicola TaxID=2729598 RepID=A0A7Y0DY58_9PROT|nr:heme biosynthesis HemY N-terminal domain-containing protein [Pacificispira spongiicola]NMM43765.1 tetratricopeptide repeat protein [Pacificispira spongiicola]
MTWRVFWFLIKIGIVGALAVYFALEPGRVTIDWQGWAVDMPVGIFGLALLVLVLLFVYGERIRQSLFRFPGRWRAQRKAIREMKGYRALTLGMVAVAAGDAEESRRQSRRARDLLTEAPLTMLLQAQTARLTGDDAAATRYFETLRSDPEAAFLGVRGLMVQALRAGDKARALELAEEARKLRPSAKWVLIELLDLQMEAGLWSRAQDTLIGAQKSGAISAGDAAPIRARLAKQQARTALESQDRDGAMKAVKQALKAAPDDAEAAVLSAKLQREAGQTRKAEKTIEAAWKTQPTHALAKAYRDIAPDGVDVLLQVKRFEQLLSLAPDHPEGHMALAEAALDAELWGEARSHLAKATPVLESDEDGVPAGPVPPRLCALWARLEEAEHGDIAAAHRWLMRAAEAEAAAEDARALVETVPPLPRADDGLPV